MCSLLCTICLCGSLCVTFNSNRYFSFFLSSPMSENPPSLTLEGKSFIDCKIRTDICRPVLFSSHLRLLFTLDSDSHIFEILCVEYL